MKFVYLCLLFVAVYAQYDCHDENNKPVDWWIALKHPNGGTYSYIDANSNSQFKRSLYNLNDAKGGAVTNTVLQLYKAKATDGVAVYNDQDDTGHQLASHAHSKGFAVFNGGGGFWVIHSLPKWPNRRSSGYDGLSDDRYGQSFMCLSLDQDQFDTVGSLWATNWVQFYDTQSTDAIAKKLPNFDSAVAGDKSGEEQLHKVITTNGGQQFDAFAKDKGWDDALYVDFVAPTLATDLIVESWQNGVGSLPSNCTGDWFVENVADISMPQGDSWTINQDHSKWALSQDGKVYTACVGDIN